jgi:hypothetical protein
MFWWPAMMIAGLFGTFVAGAFDLALRFATSFETVPFGLAVPLLLTLFAAWRIRRMRRRGMIVVDPLLTFSATRVEFVRAAEAPERFARQVGIEIVLWACVIAIWGAVPITTSALPFLQGIRP